MLGVDHRQYGLVRGIKGFVDVSDVRSENTVEAWTRTEVAVGAVVGALSSRDAATQFHARSPPIGVRLTAAFATWYHMTGSLIQGTRPVK